MSARQTAGDVLGALMAAYKLNGRGVAAKLGIDPMQISRIRRGVLPISPRNAALLGRFFGTGALFWLELQAKDDAHQLENNRKKYGDLQDLLSTIRPISEKSSV